MFLIAAAASFAAAVPRYEDSWIRAVIDWPTRGVDRNGYTIIAAELTVDTHGYASNCEAHAAAGNPKMAAYTCHLLKLRAEFSPARDPADHRIYGLHRVHIIWWGGGKPSDGLPDFDFEAHVGTNVHLADSDRRIRISFGVDASGSLLSCAPLSDGHSSLVSAAACAQLPAALHRPVLDRSGKPVLAVEDAVAKVIP